MGFLILALTIYFQAAVDIFTEEPSLEKRMWKFCAVRVGTALLQNHFAFKVLQMYSWRRLIGLMRGCFNLYVLYSMSSSREPENTWKNTDYTKNIFYG